MNEQNILELTESFRSGLNIGKCAVCLDVLQPETMVYTDNTVFCQKCVYLECSYKPCQILIKAGDDHEDYCRFRPINCKVPSCAWQGTCGELYDHVFKNRHEHYSCFGRCPFYSDTDFDIDKNYLGLDLNIQREILYWIELRYEPSSDMTFTFQPIFSCKPESVIEWVKICFESKGLELIFKMQLNLDDGMSSDDHRISVANAMVRKFVDKDDFKLNIVFEDQ